MTSDQNFLQALRIRPDDPATENWMEWRENDIAGLRSRFETMESEHREHVSNWINQTAEQDARANRNRTIAWVGWLFALMLFTAPMIARWTR